MRENTDQNNSEYRHFLRSECLFQFCMFSMITELNGQFKIFLKYISFKQCLNYSFTTTCRWLLLDLCVSKHSPLRIYEKIVMCKYKLNLYKNSFNSDGVLNQTLKLSGNFILLSLIFLSGSPFEKLNVKNTTSNKWKM